MSGDVRITIHSGGDVDLTGAAIGSGARATTIRDSQLTIELPRHFDDLAAEFRRLAEVGAISAPQLMDLTKQADETKTLLLKATDEPASREAAQGAFVTLVGKFKDFCSEHHRKGVFSCLQAVAALAGIGASLAGLPGAA